MKNIADLSWSSISGTLPGWRVCAALCRETRPTDYLLLKQVLSGRGILRACMNGGD
jgi:hypothetical protein